MNRAYLVILIFTVFSVYSLKAFRFYFLVAGSGIPLVKYICVFAQTSFVNIIVPFKAGEIFRLFCFGHLTKNYPKGFAIVLLDRFVDTLSLLAILLVANILDKTETSAIFFLLVAVCAFLILFYAVLHGILVYWNEYFIKSKSSRSHLNALIFVNKLTEVYDELRNLVNGRFFLIFMLSIFSWGIEIGSLLLCRIFFDFEQKAFISNYLSAALSGNNFLPLRNFILVSMGFLACVWVLSSLLLLVKKIERNKHER